MSYDNWKSEPQVNEQRQFVMGVVEDLELKEVVRRLVEAYDYGPTQFKRMDRKHYRMDLEDALIDEMDWNYEKDMS